MRAYIFGVVLMVLAAAGFAGSASAGIVIAIDKSAQRMSVSVDGVQKYVWPVSTGRMGYATPSGSFTPFRMEVDHFSEEWDDAPMPNSIFFTPKGHAIHGSFVTRRLGTAASHGCVRLAPKNAATLFALVQAKGMYNTKILIGDRVKQGGKLLKVNGKKPKKKIIPYFAK
ncbi:MAG: L,D-transpeptidase [Bauldia sp.]|nr:MAG: L,D-transpeptidase [Bauldia sp.]